MSEIVKFSGRVMRKEADGFTVVRFDMPIGPSANTHGLISNSTGTVSGSLVTLKPGVHVAGTAEADEHDLASIKTVRVTP